MLSITTINVLAVFVFAFVAGAGWALGGLAVNALFQKRSA